MNKLLNLFMFVSAASEIPEFDDVLEFLRGRSLSVESAAIVKNEILPMMRTLGFKEEAQTLLNNIDDYLAENTE